MGGQLRNPAKGVADALNGISVAGATVSSVIAPSVFNQMAGVVTHEIDRLSPDIVIMLGEFCGRSMITVERLAQNLIDATRYNMGDDLGSQPQDAPVVPGGPAAYYTTLPIRAMVKAMRRNGVPSDISDTAGTFGCNLLMYSVLHHIAQGGLRIRRGLASPTLASCHRGARSQPWHAQHVLGHSNRGREGGGRSGGRERARQRRSHPLAVAIESVPRQSRLRLNLAGAW